MPATNDAEQELTSPADPGHVWTPQDFGRELTALRLAAGLTVRQVARASGLPVSTVGDYFSGRHLPGLAQQDQVTRILAVCGEADPARLTLWTSALGRARRQPGRRPTREAPYRGLARFEVEDARWFFGREDMAETLAELAGSAKSPEDDASHAREKMPLILVGPSGSGKSSLLRAGLLPRLDGPVVVIDLTNTPLEELETQLGELACPDAAGRTAIVVDQFEAIFTRCQDEARRSAIIAKICELAGAGPVILALRADFYGHALRYPGLSGALQDRQLVLGPMTVEEVRRAIIEPARLARLDVEDGLVPLLLRDIAPRAARRRDAHDAAEVPPGPAGPRTKAAGAYEPGNLPLLSHAMLATWEHSRGARLTIDGYLAGGGIRDALIRTAEGAYAGLTEREQQYARRVFLRLVHVADEAGMPPTRAAIALSELRSIVDAEAEKLLATFINERLITVDADIVQITHDALLTEWPRLRSWIDEGIEGLRTRRRISEAARAWQAAGRESAALWRGSQLTVAREWVADEDNRASMEALAGEFVRTSVDEDRARERAERRQTRRLRRLVAALTALTVAVLGVAAYALEQRQAAALARDRANSRDIAIEAGLVRGQDPPLAAALSTAAYRIARTPQAAASLIESSGSPSALQLTDSQGVVESAALSPDHRLLAVAAADGTLRLWNVAASGHRTPVGGPLVRSSNDPLYTTAFSPDGTLLAAAGAAHTVTLWNVASPRHPKRLATLTGPTDTVYSVAFSPNGRLLAAGSADKTVRLWNVSNPAHPNSLGQPMTGAAGYVQSVAFAPGGTILAAGSADKTIRLWNITSPAHPVAVGKPLTGPGNIVTSVAFNPAGSLLAAGCQDNKVWLWHVRSAGPGRVTTSSDGALTGATDWVNTVAFSPDGTRLAAGSSDASVLVWDVASRSLVARLPHPQPVTSVAWDGSGRLAAGDADGTVSLWTLPSPILLTGNPAFDAVFSPAGTTLAVGTQNSLQLWDARRRVQLASRPMHGTFVNAAVFAPHAAYLAAAYGDGQFQLWRAARTLAPLSPPLRASSIGQLESVSVSPDGHLLATGGDDGTVRLWSLLHPAQPKLLAVEHDSKANVMGVAFAPNSKMLAAASGDNLTRLWNVTDPANPKLIGHPLAGPASYAMSVAFSPGGQILAVGSADKTVTLWNVTSPGHPARIGAPLTGPTGYVYGLAFSPDGRTLAAAVTDGTVWLWHVTARGRARLMSTLTGPAGHVYSVNFDPAGHVLAAASADGTVRLWDTSPAAAATAICASSGQALTNREWATYVPGIPYQRQCRR